MLSCLKAWRCLDTNEDAYAIAGLAPLSNSAMPCGRELLLFKSNELHCCIDTMEIMPEHAHLFLKARPDLSIPKMVGGLKGCSSCDLRSEFPYLKRMPSLWTRSYYAETT